MTFNWTKTHIQTKEAALKVFEIIKKFKPKYHAFDTETTGLHIILDKPFLYQFGFIDLQTKQGWAFAVDLERQPKLARNVIAKWQSYLAQNKHILIGANITFDMHMVNNIELPIPEAVRLTDLQYWIRYGHDALSIKEGGPPLALKDYATRYVNRNAKLHDKLLKQEQSRIAGEYNNQLKKDLLTCTIPKHLQHKFKKFTLACLQEGYIKDPIFEPKDLPDDVKAVYQNWLINLPVWLQRKVNGLVDRDDIPYNKLDRVTLIKYGLDDIIWTLESFWLTYQAVKARENMKAVRLENKLLPVVYKMERVGFLIDAEYLEEARVKLRNYILQQRAALREASGRLFKIGQHAFIKQMLSEDFNWDLSSTQASVVDTELSELIRTDPDNPAIEVMQLIQELRTLEKWYSAYIGRFQKTLKAYDTKRLYTQLNQVGAITGRFTSDFQQFPRDAIQTKDGTELFHPRKIVIVSNSNGYDALGYCDFSQIELRFQAFYTILVGTPDLNLCRAYMPHECVRFIEGTPDFDETVTFTVEPFNYNNPKHIKEWQDVWYLKESIGTGLTPVKWHPTDVHAATTIAAGYSPDDPNFKHYRSDIGKRTNFAKRVDKLG